MTTETETPTPTTSTGRPDLGPTYLVDHARAALAAAAERGFYMVHSETDPGASYRVTFVMGHPVACTCKGYTYRGKCKHLALARDLAETLPVR